MEVGAGPQSLWRGGGTFDADGVHAERSLVPAHGSAPGTAAPEASRARFHHEAAGPRAAPGSRSRPSLSDERGRASPPTVTRTLLTPPRTLDHVCGHQTTPRAPTVRHPGEPPQATLTSTKSATQTASLSRYEGCCSSNTLPFQIEPGQANAIENHRSQAGARVASAASNVARRGRHPSFPWAVKQPGRSAGIDRDQPQQQRDTISSNGSVKTKYPRRGHHGIHAPND